MIDFNAKAPLSHSNTTDLACHNVKQHFAPVTRAFKYILSLFIELAFLPFVALIYPFGAINLNPKKLPPDCQKVTILVHGFLHNRTAWFFLKHKLKKHPEFGPIFTINLGHPFQSIEDYTAKLSREIEKIRTMTKGKLEINFVGHSMGGLVCANYATGLPADSPVTINKIVTLASPLQGSKIAFLAKWAPCGREMKIDAPFIRKLNQKVQHLPKDLFCHIGCSEDLIVHKDLAHFMGRQNNREVKLLGHLACLASSTVADYVVKGLQNLP